jgi:hypothetical protein
MGSRLATLPHTTPTTSDPGMIHMMLMSGNPSVAE